MIAVLHKQGVNPLFGFTIDQDAKNANRYIPQLMQGGLGLHDRDYYLKTDAKTKEIRAKYLSYMTQMFGFLGDTSDVAAKMQQMCWRWKPVSPKRL
jgi:putative endopeptidase